MKYANLFYFHTLNSIGGIETFFYQLAKKYGKDFDITIFYRDADPAQIRRLSQYARLKKYRDGRVLHAKRAFVCFNTDIMGNIEADEYYQMLHGEYTKLGVYPQTHPKITKWISVSEVVRDAYKKGKGEDSIVSYNPYTPVKPRKVLNLVSATRLTSDKGWNRMCVLADAFDKAGVPFQWAVYTDAEKAVTNQSITLKPPRLDVVDFMADADYYVQLSDAEGYCYSVVEALSVGTPVIVTGFSVAHEIGVVNGKNGWILPMSMENLPIAEIYKGLKKFEYKPLPDKWGELLVKGDSNYEETANDPVKVRCRKYYFDLQLNRTVNCGEEWECTRRRADELENLDLVEVLG
jgi:glycosyltransferase involved in cell wall biosynthesis